MVRPVIGTCPVIGTFTLFTKKIFAIAFSAKAQTIIGSVTGTVTLSKKTTKKETDEFGRDRGLTKNQPESGIINWNQSYSCSSVRATVRTNPVRCFEFEFDSFLFLPSESQESSIESQEF